VARHDDHIDLPLVHPYRLSYRDLVDIMAERGIQVTHTTFLRWVLQIGKRIQRRLDSITPSLFVQLGTRVASVCLSASKPHTATG